MYSWSRRRASTFRLHVDSLVNIGVGDGAIGTTISVGIAIRAEALLLADTVGAGPARLVWTAALELFAILILKAEGEVGLFD